MIGDLNTNTQKKDAPIYKSFRDFCLLLNLNQLITQFTRFSATTQSTIDLVLTSDRSKISRSGVTEYGLSDHYIIFCTRKIQRAAVNCHNTIRFRFLKDYSIESLAAALGDLDWSHVFNCTSVEKAWSVFRSLFLSVIDQLAPMKVVRVKVRTELWVNANILKAIRLRNDSFTKYRETRDEH